MLISLGTEGAKVYKTYSKFSKQITNLSLSGSSNLWIGASADATLTRYVSIAFSLRVNQETYNAISLIVQNSAPGQL